MPPTERTALCQFNLRSLFVFISATAVCALVASRCGYVEAAGTGLSFLLLAASLRMPRFRGVVLIRSALMMLAMGVLWFAAVDRSVFMLRCKHCRLDRAEVQLRVFHLPCRSWCYDHDLVICQVAEDLGVPCQHELDGWHKHRFWGLVFCCYPCINGITGLTGPKWYDDEMRSRVRRLREQDPDRGKEFRDEVLVKQNFAYFRKFVAEIQAMEDP